MNSTFIVVALTLLCIANAFLLCSLAYSSKEKANKETKVGFRFIAAVLVLNTLFLIGGVLIW